MWSYPPFRNLGAGRVKTWEDTEAKAILYTLPLLSYRWMHGKIRRVQREQIQNPARFAFFATHAGSVRRHGRRYSVSRRAVEQVGFDT